MHFEIFLVLSDLFLDCANTILHVMFVRIISTIEQILAGNVSSDELLHVWIAEKTAKIVKIRSRQNFVPTVGI